MIPEPAVDVLNDEVLASEDLERKVLEESEESAREYLLRGWFYGAMEAARNARLVNGLTQAEVADRMGTTQSAVARLENAHTGNFSLDRFLRYAWECGAAPLDLEFVPAKKLCQYALYDPSAPRTAQAFRWHWVSTESAKTATEFARNSATLASVVSRSLAGMVNSSSKLSAYLTSTFNVELDISRSLTLAQQEAGAGTRPAISTAAVSTSTIQPGFPESAPERPGLQRAA